MLYVYPKPGDTTHEYSIDRILLKLTMSCHRGTYIPGTETLSSMHWQTCMQGLYIDEMYAPGQNKPPKNKQQIQSAWNFFLFMKTVFEDVFYLLHANQLYPWVALKITIHTMLGEVNEKNEKE